MYVKFFTTLYVYILCMHIAKKVGNNLKRARKDTGLTQKQVAEALHMRQQQYSRFENGVYELDYEKIKELCRLFDITETELFDISE